MKTYLLSILVVVALFSGCAQLQAASSHEQPFSKIIVNSPSFGYDYARCFKVISAEQGAPRDTFAQEWLQHHKVDPAPLLIAYKGMGEITDYTNWYHVNNTLLLGCAQCLRRSFFGKYIFEPNPEILNQIFTELPENTLPQIREGFFKELFKQLSDDSKTFAQCESQYGLFKEPREKVRYFNDCIKITSNKYIQEVEKERKARSEQKAREEKNLDLETKIQEEDEQEAKHQAAQSTKETVDQDRITSLNTWLLRYYEPSAVVQNMSVDQMKTFLSTALMPIFQYAKVDKNTIDESDARAFITQAEQYYVIPTTYRIAADNAATNEPATYAHALSIKLRNMLQIIIPQRRKSEEVARKQKAGKEKIAAEQEAARLRQEERDAELKQLQIGLEKDKRERDKLAEEQRLKMEQSLLKKKIEEQKLNSEQALQAQALAAQLQKNDRTDLLIALGAAVAISGGVIFWKRDRLGMAMTRFRKTKFGTRLLAISPGFLTTLRAKFQKSGHVVAKKFNPVRLTAALSRA